MSFKKMLFVVTALFIGAKCWCAASARLDADTPLHSASPLMEQLDTEIVEKFLGCAALDTVARQLEPTVVSALIDAHFNALIKQRPVNQACAVYWKEKLIVCIELAVRRVINDCEQGGQYSTRNEFQSTLNVLKTELLNAKNLDEAGLLRGEIICNGLPRFSLMQIGQHSESGFELLAIDPNQKVAEERNSSNHFGLRRGGRTPGAIEEGIAGVVTDVDSESDISDVDQVRNIGRACAIS